MSPSNEPFAPQPAEQATAAKARVPLGWRDACGKRAHLAPSRLLVPLNVCRHENLYATWKCDDERHIYEKCQYDDYINRMKLLSKQELAKADA
ncbi:hypothetical protein Rhopal_002749-T1 [Rhodotorula paludigena]|uniref:NADH dehydrogenase [ubiquinone] 1 beta subcomplex subunit 7 n=1 Tax=Rhodotorula paludigena TaxID=86838 RepID=A0AAV5GJT7_9BASI|nr:hypothetical protein Rhopal_002749-T1 [Rhodotorula paludigena]